MGRRTQLIPSEYEGPRFPGVLLLDPFPGLDHESRSRVLRQATGVKGNDFARADAKFLPGPSSLRWRSRDKLAAVHTVRYMVDPRGRHSCFEQLFSHLGIQSHDGVCRAKLLHHPATLPCPSQASDVSVPTAGSVLDNTSLAKEVSN